MYLNFLVKLPESGEKFVCEKREDITYVKYEFERIYDMETLGLYFKERDLGLFMDLAVYSIITENNAGQYYPDYAYNHPLFTNDMKIYSDATVSDFLHAITDEQSVGFLNEWNGARNYL